MEYLLIRHFKITLIGIRPLQKSDILLTKTFLDALSDEWVRTTFNDVERFTGVLRCG